MVGDLDQSVLNIAQILPINIPNDINTNVAWADSMILLLEPWVLEDDHCIIRYRVTKYITKDPTKIDMVGLSL
jgi:hypothetical protein